MKSTPEIMKETEAVLLDRIYPQSLDQVWRALTSRRALERWLLPNDFLPHLGHRFTFRGPRRRIECEVIAVDEGKRLAYTWREGDEPLSVVSWTLEPVPSGTHVRLRHEPVALASAHSFNLWPGALQSLAAVMESVPQRLFLRYSVRQPQTGMIRIRERGRGRLCAVRSQRKG